MIAFIWKLVIGGLWRPIAAILGALGLYVKGRADAKAKDDKRALEAHADTVEDVLNETVSDGPADAIRRRMRERAGEP